MCGRFTLRASPNLIAESIGLFDGLPDAIPARYNIAPTQWVLTLLQAGDKPEYRSLKWGLIPSWADDMKIASRLLNARSERIAEKPSFRAAFKKRRCLIPADGFYEWQAAPAASPKAIKQPYHIHRPDDRPFAFAGLWETWPKGEKPLESCTIITTSANGLMAPLHDRMPVILDPRDYARWLSPDPTDPAILLEMLRPCPDDWLAATRVTTAVNNARRDAPECLEPMPPAE